MRKPVFGVSDQVRHKPGCAATEDGYRLGISGLKSREIVLYMYGKKKALISFAVTGKLICVFVFAYAKRLFSHDAAQFLPLEFYSTSYSMIFLLLRSLKTVNLSPILLWLCFVQFLCFGFC